MKPTQQQQQYLSDYLSSSLVYRETYNEFYDHILTALEHEPENISFNSSVKDLVKNEFGGVEGLRLLEENYQQRTLKEMQRRYFKYLTAYLKFPLIVPLVATLILVYFMLNGPWLSRSWFFAILFSVAFVPSVLNWIRAIRLGYLKSSTKKSIKDDGFVWMKYMPVTVFGILVLYKFLFSNTESAMWFNDVDPASLTVLLTAYLLHTQAYYKMYKEQFKLSLVK